MIKNKKENQIKKVRKTKKPIKNVVKLTLAEKQELKLKAQKLKEAKKAANGEDVPKNKDRFYCTNKELQQELLLWRNSDPKGLSVLKNVNGKLVKTNIFNTNEQHEPYAEGVEYFVKIPTERDDYEIEIYDNKTHSNIKQIVKGYNTKLLEKAKKELEVYKKTAKDPSKYNSFYETHKTWILHNITETVKREGWAFNYDIVDERKLTEHLGNMIIAIGDKLLNHSSFRAYDSELKLDMRSQYILKLIKGLKNYNFKFNNPFAFFTTCAWNSFLIVLNQHYKHQNIRNILLQKMVAEIQSYTGMSPNSGLSKYITSYLENEQQQ